MSLGLAVSLLDGPAAANQASLAWLRGLTGADELLLDEAASEFPATRVTRLLATVTARIGDITPVTVDVVRGLTIGDRERLLVGCAMATFGSELDVVARCPHEDCRELAELSVSLADLLEPLRRSDCPSEHRLDVATDGGVRELRFRLPTGADQEAVAEQALTDLRSGAASLLDRCLIAPPDTAGRANDEAAVSDAIAALDPAFEWTAEAKCPACGRPVRTLLDGLTLLTSGASPSGRLYGEIDRLARAYHWSEEAILALPVSRRRRYLDLIAAHESA
jgi:hypothetical protein